MNFRKAKDVNYINTTINDVIKVSNGYKVLTNRHYLRERLFFVLQRIV